MVLGGKLFVVLFTFGFLIQLPAYSKLSKQTYVKGIYSLPLTLDPIKMNDAASLSVGNLIYDGLLKFSPSLKIEGALAESWSTSPDGKTLTFKLRPNITFHDGRKITTSDAEASIIRAMSAESTVRKFFDCIETIKAIDDKTLEIVLSHPFPPFLSVLAGATAKILPKDKVQNPSFFKTPVGSGAFKYAIHSKTEIQLDGNQAYYTGAPSIGKMILKVTNEEEAHKLARAGEIHDLANWPLTESDPIFSFGKKVSSPVAATWIIGLNALTSPFRDVQTRQLFKNNVPVEKFRTSFYPDAQPAHGYIPNGLPGSQVRVTIDSKNAKPSKQKIKLAVPQELARANDIKKLLEDSMSKQGWKLEVVLLPWDKLMEGYSNKTLQAFLVSMNMDYPDADFLLKNFESDNPDNFSGLKNKRLDELLKLSRSTQDRKQREVYYSEALKLTEERAVTVNLFHPRANYWISSCVEGFSPNILSDVYIDYTKVKLTEACDSQQVVRR